MGGRGKKSGSGAGQQGGGTEQSPTKARQRQVVREPDGHLKWNDGIGTFGGAGVDDDEFADTVAKNMSESLGISYGTAAGYTDAVMTFTGMEYADVRRAVQKGDTSGEYGMKGAACEEFIKRAIETGNGWNDGPTYRGITVDDATLSSILSNGTSDVIDINMGAMASWSTSKSVADEFSGYGMGDNQVVFVHEGKSQMGVSVKNISSSGTHDNEVMVSKNAKYKLTGKKPEQRDGIWYVYVEGA